MPNPFFVAGQRPGVSCCGPSDRLDAAGIGIRQKKWRFHSRTRIPPGNVRSERPAASASPAKPAPIAARDGETGGLAVGQDHIARVIAGQAVDHLSQRAVVEDQPALAPGQGAACIDRAGGIETGRRGDDLLARHHHHRRAQPVAPGDLHPAALKHDLVAIITGLDCKGGAEHGDGREAAGHPERMIRVVADIEPGFALEQGDQAPAAVEIHRHGRGRVEHHGRAVGQGDGGALPRRRAVIGLQPYHQRRSLPEGEGGEAGGHGKARHPAQHRPAAWCSGSRCGRQLLHGGCETLGTPCGRDPPEFGRMARIPGPPAGEFRPRRGIGGAVAQGQEPVERLIGRRVVMGLRTGRVRGRGVSSHAGVPVCRLSPSLLMRRSSGPILEKRSPSVSFIFAPAVRAHRGNGRGRVSDR